MNRIRIVISIFLFFLMNGSVFGATFQCQKDIPSYNADKTERETIKKGTVLEVSDIVNQSGMISIVYTNDDGELISAFCQATDLGRKNTPTPIPTPKPTPQSKPSTATTESPAEEEEGWLTDYSQALSLADTEKKMVLMDFTGSDWCGWCIRLDKEVFNQREFKDYAEKNLVLLKLDYPRKKILPDEIKKQNQELQAKYGITGYPTVIILDSKGKQIARLGYTEGGPPAFIAKLEKIKK